MVERERSRPIRLATGAANRAKLKAGGVRNAGVSYPEPVVRSPSRVGRKAIVGWLDPILAKQVRMAPAGADRSIQSVVEEALAEWLYRNQ